MKQKKVIWLFGYLVIFLFLEVGEEMIKKRGSCARMNLSLYDLSDIYLTLYASLRAPSPITTSMTIGFLPYFS